MQGFWTYLKMVIKQNSTMRGGPPVANSAKSLSSESLQLRTEYSKSLINTQIGSKKIQKPWHCELYTMTMLKNFLN